MIDTSAEYLGTISNQPVFRRVKYFYYANAVEDHVYIRSENRLFNEWEGECFAYEFSNSNFSKFDFDSQQELLSKAKKFSK